MIKNICVYCGSSYGKSIHYKNAAIELSDLLYENNLRLVYGGGNIGLMGELANNLLKKGGEVIGVIPKIFLNSEVAHYNLSVLHVVENMHQRKEKMAEISDAFIALPGGFGTLDEIIEIITWKKIRLHNKPCAFLNTDGYYNNLIAFFENLQQEQFSNKENNKLFIVENEPKDIINQFIRTPFEP